MKVLKRWEDQRYVIVEAESNGTTFIYLKDKHQKTESLGIPEGKVNVKELWEKHLSEEEFCLPCELLLRFKHKVVTAENSVAELGLTLEKLKEFKKILKG